MPQNNTARSRERGNVFIFILLGVVLFAALSYTVARGMRGDTVSSMSERQEDLAITEIVNYAQRMENAISRLRRKGCSENDISFEQASVAGYTNAGSPGDNTCHVFHTSGGRMKWTDPPDGFNDGSPWLFTGSVRIYDLGPGMELLMLLPRISQQSCMKINDRLNINNVANDAPEGIVSLAENKFQGSFPAVDGIGNLDTEVRDEQSSCFKERSTDDYWYVKALIIR